MADNTVTKEQVEEAMDSAGFSGSWDITDEGTIIIGIDRFGNFGGYELTEGLVRERLNALKVIAHYMGIEDN